MAALYETNASKMYHVSVDTNFHKGADGSGPTSSWQRRKYLDGNNNTFATALQGSPLSGRLDFSAFINSMDDASFAYFSLLREYASRPLQAKNLEYEGLYRALASQQAQDERMSRISVVEFEKGGSRSKTFTVFEECKDYLHGDTEDTSNRRLIVLEDMPVRLVCLLGSRLHIHPSIFARHYSTEDNSTISDNIASFPSITCDSTKDGLEYESQDGLPQDSIKRNFTLRYPITMPRVSAKQHPDPRLCPPWLKPSSRFRDRSAYPNFMVERVLDTPTKHDEWDSRGEMSELEGLVTYWSQTLSGGGWTALLVVDPCLKDPSHIALISGAPHTNLSREIRYPELDDYEKVDLATNPLQWHPGATFTKYVLHDDILIHFSVSNTDPGRSALAITKFVRGFTISKWAAHLNHISRCYSHTRAALFSSNKKNTSEIDNVIDLVQHTARWGADWKEWMFETMTRSTTDLYIYRLQCETNMRALGIDIDDSASYGFVGKREAQTWRYIRSSCMDLQEMFEQLTNSYTQVVALREAQTSNLQAKSVRWLTVLGTFFVPMSVVAGVMSMGGDFLPGEKRFWIYPAVVVPTILIIGVVMVLITRWEKRSKSQ